MARKHKHEEHTNHEAWAIPYGDLITLLLAFFVVMYAVSSINEGKYRVLADSLSTALGGPAKTLKPIQVGENPEAGAQANSILTPITTKAFPDDDNAPAKPLDGADKINLRRMADQVQQAMQGLIDQNMVQVRRTGRWLEIEMNTDILFPSGVAQVNGSATPILVKLANILKPFPNELRIEGYTDNVPINTVAFPSNWELSAARAASVVHLFMQNGVDPRRMTVVGLGEYHPVASNATAEGRNRNRRVVVIVMGDTSENRRPVSPDQVRSVSSVPVAIDRGADAGADAGSVDTRSTP